MRTKGIDPKVNVLALKTAMFSLNHNDHHKLYWYVYAFQCYSFVL